MRVMRLAGLVVAAWLACASGALADDREDAARALFDRGVELSEQERWGEALEYFRRSRDLVDRPSTVFNMAVAELRLGQPTVGIASLDAYLASTEDNPAEEHRRAEATRLREIARASVVTLHLEIVPPDAEVRVDGTAITVEGPSRDIEIDPGTHRIQVTADGYEPSGFELSVLEGEQAERAVALAHLPGPTGPALVRIAASVRGATILVDGEVVAAGSYRGQLQAGRHRVEVRADGYEPFHRVLTVEPEQRLDVHASLSRSATLFESPWVWIAAGVIVATAAGIAIGVAASSGEADPYGGNTGVVLFGLAR